jgi:hypothetical protein
MEPRKIERPIKSRGEGRTSGQTSLPRQLERKRRFQIIKLEERIAPGCDNHKGSNHYACNTRCFNCG